MTQIQSNIRIQTLLPVGVFVLKSGEREL